MSENPMTSTGMDEEPAPSSSKTLNSVIKTPVKRSAEVSSKEQKKAEDGRNESNTPDEPSIKRKKPESSSLPTKSNSGVVKLDPDEDAEDQYSLPAPGEVTYLSTPAYEPYDSDSSEDPKERDLNVLAKLNVKETPSLSTRLDPSADRIPAIVDPSSSVRSLNSPIFLPEVVNVLLQVSQNCRIGPVLDENRIRNLTPYETLPYPDLYTRVVQDLLRCAHRPEEVFSALKVSSNGEPSTVITFHDRASGAFKCKSIPVLKSVNSAQAWLSDLLDSLGCCSKLFLPDFIAKEFVCKQCFTSNERQKHANGELRDRVPVENHVVATQTEWVAEEEERKKQESERKRKEDAQNRRIEEEKRKAAEEERRAKEEMERARLTRMQEEQTKEDEEQRRKIEEELRIAEKEKNPVISETVLAPGEPDTVKPDPDEIAERYSLPPLNEVCVIEDTANLSCGVPSDEDSEEIAEKYEIKKWKPKKRLKMEKGKKKPKEKPRKRRKEGRKEAEEEMVLKEVKRRAKKMFRREEAEEREKQTEALRMLKEKRLKKKEAERKRVDEEQADEERRAEEEESKTMEDVKEEPVDDYSVRILEKEQMDTSTIRDFEEEKLEIEEMKEVKKEGRAAVELTNERYNSLNAFFFYLFKVAEGRMELRPDLGNPIVSKSPALAFKHMVRSKVFIDDGKEMWQLGDEAPTDSSILKKITSHSCPGSHYSLNTRSTMLDLWQSLLFRCPNCVNERSLQEAFDKVRKFINEECHRST